MSILNPPRLGAQKLPCGDSHDNPVSRGTNLMPPRRNKPGKFKDVIKYGCSFHRDDDPLAIELAFVAKLGKFQYKGAWFGNGLAYHVKEAMKLLWPDDMYWHRWTNLIVDEWMSGVGRVGCFGPSSSQKSFVFTRIGLVLFYARPHGTTGLISSTTLEALKRRIWDYVVSADKSARKRHPWLPGSLIESKLMLLADESNEEGRSFKNGIVGVAAKKGGAWQGLEEYVGLKNEVVFVIADELHFMPIGILDSLANLESNDNCFFAGLGNLPDIHNPLGRLCEPKMGWDALPDTDKSRVFETKWKNGRCIQLIGLDSPNLDFPEGREPYKNLIGRRYIEQCAENYGRESDKFNMFASGKIPRASMSRTVFSKAMCMKFNATEQVKWGHQQVVRGYMMDAAYSGVGGDRTAGAPFIFGKDVTGRWKFWMGPIKLYPGSDSPKISHSEAIAIECKKECEAHDIPPAHVFYDGTGRSELTSAFARLWSPQVVPIEFGGPATERPSFTGEKHLIGETKDDKNAGEIKTCKEVFDRLVTELWFAIRYCIQNDQMRGMTEDVIEEGSQRKWELVRGNKYCIETKEDMKERGLRSPDLTDMLVVGLEGARRLGFPLGKTPETKAQSFRWLESMREHEWDRIKKDELETV